MLLGASLYTVEHSSMIVDYVHIKNEYKYMITLYDSYTYVSTCTVHVGRDVAFYQWNRSFAKLMLLMS